MWIVAIPLLALADRILISQQLDRDTIRVGRRCRRVFALLSLHQFTGVKAKCGVLFR